VGTLLCGVYCGAWFAGAFCAPGSCQTWARSATASCQPPCGALGWRWAALNAERSGHRGGGRHPPCPQAPMRDLNDAVQTLAAY